MATVPTYQRQIGMESMPSVRVQPSATQDTFGVGLAQTATKISNDQFEALKKQKEIDDAKAGNKK